MPVVLNKKINRILAGTVGYHLLSNHSVGPVILPQLQKMVWPGGIVFEELNWGPIAIVQYFQSLPEPFDRVIIITAIQRSSRKTGEITIHRWAGGLPSEEQIQACIGDAVTGVISVENLLIIGEYFKIWPSDVFVVDVEPGEEKAGEHLSPEMEATIPAIINTIQHLVTYNEKNLSIENLYGEVLIAQL